MRRIVRNKKKKVPTKYVLIILTFVCIISIFLSLVLNISGGPLKTVAGYVFIPMQDGINNIGSFLSDKSNDFKTLNEVLEENEQLQKQVADLTTQLNTTKLERYELENYRDLLALDEKYPSYEKIAANIIAKDSGNWFSTFTINRGTNHGVKVGMNVISGSGLVGIVTDVGPNYAKVRSIIDDSNNVSVMTSSTGDNFTVSGDLQLMNESKMIRFSGLKDENDAIQIGEPIVTSYVSDMYQQGILVGYVTSISQDSNSLTKSGKITPVADFEHISEVLVIMEVKNTGDDTTEAVEEEKN